MISASALEVHSFDSNADKYPSSFCSCAIKNTLPEWTSFSYCPSKTIYHSPNTQYLTHQLLSHTHTKTGRRFRNFLLKSERVCIPEYYPRLTCEQKQRSLSLLLPHRHFALTASVPRTTKEYSCWWFPKHSLKLPPTKTTSDSCQRHNRRQPSSFLFFSFSCCTFCFVFLCFSLVLKSGAAVLVSWRGMQINDVAGRSVGVV